MVLWEDELGALCWWSWLVNKAGEMGPLQQKLLFLLPKE